MAIVDTISSMYENVGEVYDTITNVDLPTYKNIQNIPSTMRSSYLEIMNNGIDKIWNNWEKVEGTGETLTLNSTEEAPMKINLKGNTSQETTTGKNKYNATRSSATTNAVTYSGDTSKIYINGTPNNAGRIFFNKTYLEAGTYAFSATLSKGSFTNGGNNLTYLYLYKGTETTASWDFDTRILLTAIIGNVVSATFTISEGSYYYLAWYLDASYTWTNAEIKYQVETGNSFTSFEPYTGGQASPNPDYPQDIHVVSGDNSIKVEGKNLIPLSDIISTGGTTSNGITFTLQADGTIKANGTATAGISIYLTTNYIEQKAGTYTFSDGIVSGQSSTTYFLYADVRHLDETPWDTKYFSTFETTTRTRTIEEAFKFKPRIVVRQGQTLNNVVFKPMLENGSTATTYEEYKGASYPINLGVKNLWNNQLSGFLPQSGSYPTTDPSYPNARYVLIDLPKGQSITLSGITFDGSGRVRYIDKDTNQVVGNMTYLDSAYYIATHTFGDGFYEGTITAKKDFIVGIMDLNGNVNNLIVNYGTTPQYISSTPIELFKIGTYQDSIKKSTGKNLFDNSLLNKEIAYQATTSISNGVLTITSISSTGVSFARLLPTLTLLPNTQYTCSFDINGAFLQARIYDVDANNYTTISTSTSGSRVSGTFTTSSNTTYELVLYITLQQSCSFSKIQVEQGSTATEYEPYGSAKWYLNKQIGKVVLNGSENWNADAGTQGTDYRHNILRSRLDIPNPIGINGTYMSNYFRQHTMNNDSGFFGEFYCNSNWFIFLDKEKQYLIEGWKDWLSTHNTTVYYVLATPTYAEITDTTLLSQLEAVKRSYENQTNINQDNNDLPFILDVTALKELTQ